MTNIPPIAPNVTPTQPTPTPPAQNAQTPPQTPPSDAAPAQNQSTPNQPSQTQTQPQPSQPNPQSPAQSAPPAQPTPTPEQTAPTIPAQVVRLPPALAEQPDQIPLRGDVATHTQDGTITITTPRGDVTLRLPPNIPQSTLQAITQYGVRVLLTLPTYPATTAQITPYSSTSDIPTYTTLSGETPDTHPQTPQTLLRFLKSTLQNFINTGTTPASAPHPITSGQLVRLLPIIGNLPQTTLQPPTTPTLTLSIPTALNIVQNAAQDALSFIIGATPHPQTLPTITMLMAPMLTSSTPSTTGQTGALPQILSQFFPTPPQNPASTLQTHNFLNAANPTTLDAKILQIMPQIPTMQPPAPAVANLLYGTPKTPVIIGQFIGTTSAQLPIITLPTTPNITTQTTHLQPMQAMTLQFPATGLTQGSFIQLGVLQALPNAQTTPALPLWDALDDLVNVINTTPDSHAQNMAHLQTIMPKPGNTAFSAPVLLFMAAARGGDPTIWLGERMTDTLRNVRRSDILTRLTSALTNSLPRDENTPNTEWRSHPLPLLNDHDINRLMLHYRYFERDGQTPNEPKQRGTRFVLDISLTHMGDMQIDGLSFGKQLDVTLRSKTEFSPAMRQAMRAQYTLAIEGVGYAGVLNFAPADKWVEVTATSKSH